MVGPRSTLANRVRPCHVAAAIASAVIAACAAPAAPRDLPRGDTRVAVNEQGLVRFAFDDFGGLSRATLETNAIPYKVVATALLMDEETRQARPLGRDDIPRIFRQFGFLSSDRIVNLRSVAPRQTERPLGLISGMVGGPLPIVRIEAANLGCAACHAGTLYDATGSPTGAVWLGLPNTSLDLEALGQRVYASLKAAIRDREALRRRVEAVFPEMSWAERWTLRRILLGRIETTLAERAVTLDAPAPFSNGGPGRTNGVAALKLQLRLLSRDRMHEEHAHTSIPDLASRGLRSSLLYDGTYAPVGAEHYAVRNATDVTRHHADSLAAIAAFFTVPAMGLRPVDAERAIPAVRQVLGWFVERYRPPAFPGAINEALARDGDELYAAHCAACHGTYEGPSRQRRLTSFPNRLVPQARMGTDSVRWASIDSASLQRLLRTDYGRYMSVRQTEGYVAPILSGLWATAPYLHNGSVPTLWQLMTPGERPERFEVGGHRLDFHAVGIAGAAGADGVYRYPDGYEPWSVPELYDTRRPGLGNRGHEREFAGLSAAQKRALIEYLKGI